MNAQFRHFCFTWNNYQEHTLEEKAYLSKKLLNELEANYFIFGYETASTGTKHLQGYVQLSKRKYFSTLKSVLHATIHFEPCKGSSEDNINYCKKMGEFVEVGVHRSIARGRAKQEKDWALLIEKAKKGLLDEIECENPREYLIYYNTFRKMSMDNLDPLAKERKCLWIYGKPGSGKSRVTHKLFPDAYWKNANKWWDGYRGEQTIVLDDLDTAILFGYLKRWADRYKVIGEVKGSSINLSFNQFIVTSNYRPGELVDSQGSRPDPISIEAIARRFLLVEAVGWSDLDEDLVVQCDHYKGLLEFGLPGGLLRPLLVDLGWVVSSKGEVESVGD